MIVRLLSNTGEIDPTIEGCVLPRLFIPVSVVIVLAPKNFTELVITGADRAAPDTVGDVAKTRLPVPVLDEAPVPPELIDSGVVRVKDGNAYGVDICLFGHTLIHSQT